MLFFTKEKWEVIRNNIEKTKSGFKKFLLIFPGFLFDFISFQAMMMRNGIISQEKITQAFQMIIVCARTW